MFSRSSGDVLLSNQRKVQHYRFVLIAALDGSGSVAVDDRVVQLKDRSLLLLFPFQFHHFLNFPKDAIRWCFVSFETKLPSLLEPLRNCAQELSEKNYGLLQNIMEEITEVWPPRQEQVVQAQFHLSLILHQLLKDASPLPPFRMGQANEDAVILDRINYFIYNNISRSFTLKELAQATGYSESYLRHLFCRAQNMSLGQYVTEVRLRKATGLLHRGGLNISQISEACGYNSLYSFSRAFRHTLGCSPTEFKARCERIWEDKPAIN